MKKWITSLFVAVTLMVMSMPAFAMHPKMVKALGLSSAQETAIEKLQLQFRRQVLTLRYKLQLARLDLRVLLKPHKPNMAKLIPAIEKVGKLEVEFKKQRILHSIRVRSVLTPAQAKKAKELRRRWRRNRRRRWGRRGRWGRRHRRHFRRGGPGRPPHAPPKAPEPPKGK